MSEPAQFVFGYGSLAADVPLRPARLRGHRRVWGVAMDNSVDIPGYKSYRLSADGSRPAVFVAFLDIVADAGATVGGALVAVDDGMLRALDARERNYVRVEVTEHVEGSSAGTVWAYRGSAAGRARLALGLSRGHAVADAGYVAAVRTALDALGLDDDITIGALPALSLQRVEVAERGS